MLEFFRRWKRNMAQESSDQLRAKTAGFTRTHWSVVLAAGAVNSPEALEALEKLSHSYWYPLYAYIRRRGYEPDEAQDLTQDFFLRLLEKNYLANADPGKGKFRSFLLASLNHFLANDYRRAQAAKRGGGQVLISIDEASAEGRYALEPVSTLTPEKIYERRWALTLFDRALERLEVELTRTGKTKQYAYFKPFLTREPGEGDYASVAAELGMTAGAVTVGVHRLRQRYRELVQEEIAQTLSNPADLEEELRYLLTLLSD